MMTKICHETLPNHIWTNSGTALCFTELSENPRRDGFFFWSNVGGTFEAKKRRATRSAYQINASIDGDVLIFSATMFSVLTAGLRLTRVVVLVSI